LIIFFYFSLDVSILQYYSHLATKLYILDWQNIPFLPSDNIPSTLCLLFKYSIFYSLQIAFSIFYTVKIFSPWLFSPRFINLSKAFNCALYNVALLFIYKPRDIYSNELRYRALLIIRYIHIICFCIRGKLSQIVTNCKQTVAFIEIISLGKNYT
jgi:hypothetical protein